MAYYNLSCFAQKYMFKSSALSLDNSKISLNAIKACKILNQNGFDAYLVGGCVRDLLMNKSPKDWDLTTNATPEQIKSIFPKYFALGEKHGTITVVMGPSKADEFEITTYRVEGAYSDGRRPDSVAFSNHIEDDLSRRDLTINAMAYDPINNKLIDPYGGQKDLEDKKIKAVGDPNKRFEEDGLRTMRVARFAARFGFDVDPKTEQAISDHLSTLEKVSKERFTAELLSTLMTSKPSIGLNILFNTGALGVGDPSLADSSIVNNFNLIDTNQSASLEVKVAILLNKLNSSTLANVLKNLKFPNDKANMILFLNLVMHELVKFNNDSSPLGARKFLSFIKNHATKYPILGGYDHCLSEFLAFAKALNLPGLNKLGSLINEPAITIKDLNISGNDLISELHMVPGPKLKKVLDSLYDEVMLNPSLNNREKLLELASKFETVAVSMLSKSIIKKSNKDWWRLSDQEEQDLLDKEFNFENGLKFKAKDIAELSSQVEVPAGPIQWHPEKNQLLHTSLVFDKSKELSDDPMVWYAALLHDLGKSYTDKSLWPKQHGHEAGGVPYVESVSNLLNVPKEWKEFAKLIAEHHLKCHNAKELSQKSLKKLYESFSNNRALFNSYITTCEADAKGRLGGFADQPYDQRQFLLSRIDEGFKENKSMPSTLEISGDDLIKEFGLSPGPMMGKILKILKEMVLNDPSLNDRDTLLDLTKKLI